MQPVPTTSTALPLGRILLRLTIAAVCVAVVLPAGAWGLGYGSHTAAMLVAVAFVWAVNAASLGAIAGWAKRGPFALAMAHYFAAGGRMLLALGMGYYAVHAVQLPNNVVYVSLAAAYIPLLMVESVEVARFVRSQYPTPGQSHGRRDTDKELVI